MLIRRPADIRPSEITPREVYLDRRKLMRTGLLAGAGLALGTPPLADDAIPSGHQPLPDIEPGPFSTEEAPNTFEEITTYNNFFEFGTGKTDPLRLSGRFQPKPWQIAVDGEAEKTGEFDYDDIIRPHTLEERIYRLRCVEAWSMVVPWVGVPLADVLKRFEPNSRAKYVAFETVYRPGEMPGQQRPVLDWPYVEGLRIDEAMHPLTILAVGLYGVELPNQNGAPIRLVVPWKYGFKSIKSIVRITFTEQEPATSWSRSAPNEYGFYANVNPEVDHPRWSQARERRIGDGFFTPRRPTQMFNGYGDQVASLYEGMDLRRKF